jgi:choline dehydrogenase
MSYDYVIVGGGTAGSVLAARLSEDSAARVLLLEAGSAIPLEAMANPLRWERLFGTRVDWGFSTTPQPNLNGDSIVYPRGKVLGGSSGINAMYHIRGDRDDYDAWAAAGARGWDYASLLPFFRRSETAPGRDPAYRGTDGPMVVSVPEGRNPLWEAGYQAMLEAGFEENPDGNAASAYGATWNEMNVVDGTRRSVSDNYLRSLRRENLTVITEAQVHRLIIQVDRCMEVEYAVSGGPVESARGDL